MIITIAIYILCVYFSYKSAQRFYEIETRLDPNLIDVILTLTPILNVLWALALRSTVEDPLTRNKYRKIFRIK